MSIRIGPPNDGALNFLPPPPPVDGYDIPPPPPPSPVEEYDIPPPPLAVGYDILPLPQLPLEVGKDVHQLSQERGETLEKTITKIFFCRIIEKGRVVGEFLQKKYDVTIGVIGVSLKNLFAWVFGIFFSQKKEIQIPQYLKILEAIAEKILSSNPPLWREEGFFRISGLAKKEECLKNNLYAAMKKNSQIELSDTEVSGPEYATVFKKVFTDLYKQIAKEKKISLEPTQTNILLMTQKERIGLNDEVSREICATIKQNPEIFEKIAKLFRNVADEDGCKITKLPPEKLVLAFPQAVGLLVHIFPEKASEICEAVGGF